ncbi:hypothetical protein GFK21_22990, partial [Salmonella enterica subsp. enterica serovar Enteritidis]|nr:hypothetical protein [Salmonella enterica subsp. enterica serovar Enteritidis]
SIRGHARLCVISEIREFAAIHHAALHFLTVYVFFGVTVKLPDLITKSHLPLDDSIRVWLDQNNHLLPFSYIPQKIRLADRQPQRKRAIL